MDNSPQNALTLDHDQEDATAQIIPQSSLLISSHAAGWKPIQLANLQVPPGETPEIISLQHIIFLGAFHQETEIKLIFDGKQYKNRHQPQEKYIVQILPAYVPMSSAWDQDVTFTHCYLDPVFLTHCAHETIDPDRVEVNLALKQPDSLIWQICLALKTVLETDASNSQFYAESMATALAAHLLRFYSTRKHQFKQYHDGLPFYRLRKVTDFMQSHLTENISLEAIAAELGMSQFYFCRLFKQTTGTTPHQYLIKLRVERAKYLLKNTKLTINEVADECGFANPSHLARHFRRDMGLSPKQFRML